MASSNPVPVNILGNSASKTSKKSSKSSCPYKFINRIDGFGQYARFAFSAESLEKANLVLSDLHNNKIFDNLLSHAYTRTKDGRTYYVIHAVAHLTSRDYGFEFLRNKLPKASLHVTTYPDASYSKNFKRNQPQQNNEHVEVLQEGYSTPYNYNSLPDGIATQEPLSF